MDFSIETCSSTVGAARIFDEALAHTLFVGTVESNFELACCGCKRGGEAAFVCSFVCSSEMIARVVGVNIAVSWI